MLVTMKEILDRAAAGNYGVAAPNVSSEFDARACLEVAEDLKLTLPFTIYETTCRKEYWETIEEKDAWLDISLYPVKRQLDAKAQREEQDGRGKVE